MTSAVRTTADRSVVFTGPGSSASGLVTPEAVLLEFEPAGLAARVLAKLLDFVVIGVGLYAVLIGLAFALGSTGAETVAIVAVFVALFLALVGYPVIYETWGRGRSLGKLAVGLRVVTVEGAPVRFRHAAIRSMLFLLEGIILLGGLAAVAVLVSRRSQRLGDLAAGTLVLRERRAQSSARSIAFAPPWGYEHYASTLDVTGLDEAHYGLVRSFLLRVTQLGTDARAHLAGVLAADVAGRIGHQLPPGVHPEAFLVCVASQYQRRHDPIGWAPPPSGSPSPGPPPVGPPVGVAAVPSAMPPPVGPPVPVAPPVAPVAPSSPPPAPPAGAGSPPPPPLPAPPPPPPPPTR